MIKDSKYHLNKANESYFIYFFSALKIDITKIIVGIQAVIHAIITGILTKSASDKIKKLHEIMSKRS